MRCNIARPQNPPQGGLEERKLNAGQVYIFKVLLRRILGAWM